MRTCPKCGTRYPPEIAYCPLDGTATQLVSVEGSVAPADPLVGLTIDGRYRIEARIGEGGMGVVYRATHVVLKKPLAIKVLRGELANDGEVVQRFVQEARASSAIGHPNIIDIRDFGTTPQGAVYFTMEYLSGQTLAQAMENGPLERDRAFAILIQIASALEAAHERGIVHRDLKPDNIFLTREGEQQDFVKVLDFGIAKVKNAAAKITRTGMVFGTPHYMSPEQAAGQAVDHRSDIYSLGVIMYQVFAGQLPFDAESFMGIMTQHMFDEPVLPSQLASDLRGPIEDLIMKALQKKPEQRYQSMLSLRADLERAQSGQALRIVSEADTGPALAGFTGTQPALSAQDGDAYASADDEPIALPKQRRPTWMWLTLAALVMGVAAASFGAWGGEPRSAPTAQSDARMGDASLPVAPPPPAPDQPPSPAGAPAPFPLVAPRRVVPADKKPRPSQPRIERPRKAADKPEPTEVVDPWH